jgi:hypothetical protein
MMDNFARSSSRSHTSSYLEGKEVHFRESMSLVAEAAADENCTERYSRIDHRGLLVCHIRGCIVDAGSPEGRELCCKVMDSLYIAVNVYYTPGLNHNELGNDMDGYIDLVPLMGMSGPA